MRQARAPSSSRARRTKPLARGRTARPAAVVFAAGSEASQSLGGTGSISEASNLLPRVARAVLLQHGHQIHYRWR
jgi:hypothetical protein